MCALQIGISAKHHQLLRNKLWQKAGLGVKKIKLLLDDDASAVYEKLVSSEKDDVGDVKGFPQLREARGFEMLHCLPNCRDVPPLKCSWAAKEIRSNLGGQSKIYLRPIQKDLSTKSLLPQNSCEVKEKCMACNKEFPMSELRTHSFYMCTVGFNSGSDSEGDNGITGCIVEGTANADSGSDSSVNPGMSQAPQQIQEANSVIEVSDSPVPVLEKTQDNIDTAVGKVVTFCRTNNVHNPMEVLRCMQQVIVTGRKLELESDSEILEGETNYINVDRMNLLETALEGIGALENLRLTLEVGFFLWGGKLILPVRCFVSNILMPAVISRIYHFHHPTMQYLCIIVCSLSDTIIVVGFNMLSLLLFGKYFLTFVMVRGKIKIIDVSSSM